MSKDEKDTLKGVQVSKEARERLPAYTLAVSRLELALLIDALAILSPASEEGRRTREGLLAELEATFQVQPGDTGKEKAR